MIMDNQRAKLDAVKLTIVELRGRYGPLTRLQCIVIALVELHFGDEARAVRTESRDEAVAEYRRIATLAIQAAMEQ